MLSGLAGLLSDVPKRLKSPAIDSDASIAYIDVMATLTIRNLPDDVRDKLRVRAAHAGRSMEAEARRILAEALLPTHGNVPPEELQALVASLYGGDPPAGVVDDFIREKRKEALNDLLADGLDPVEVFGDQFVRICEEAGLDPAEVRRAARRLAG